GIALLAAAVEGDGVPRIGRRLLAQAAHQVGVENKGLAERDDVRSAAGHGGFGQFAVVAVVQHSGALAVGIDDAGLWCIDGGWARSSSRGLARIPIEGPPPARMGNADDAQAQTLSRARAGPGTGRRRTW